ncbi:MAG: NFACT family protein [Bacilli bacterium]
MAIDSVFTYYLAKEINNSVSGASIKKIYNISNNEFLIKFHNKQNLYISANNECRVNLTEIEYTFPSKPSNFTMLLRKYLSNFKVDNITNFNKDRILRIQFVGYNDLKDITSYYMYIELFGRYSNIILTDENNIIINSLKLINNETKTILPNYEYKFIKREEYVITNKANLTLNNALSVKLFPCTDNKDFYYTNIFSEEVTSYSSLSKLLDGFYYSITKYRRINFLTMQCEKKINNELKKLRKKLFKLNNDLEKNQNYEKYKNYGDLILTYGYQQNFEDSLLCNDYNGNCIEIKMDKNLNVSDNANKYYIKYSKLKRSIDHIKTQIDVTNNKIFYLDNLLYQLSICDEHEIKEIFNEYSNNSKQKKQKARQILTINEEDYTILIGKNNLQNEEITFKLSRKNDIWFHVKDLPGSHVLLKTNNLTDKKIKIAAEYAAKFSKGKAFPKVEVLYTNVKNVKKITGSYPGHVSIINEKNVIIVTPNSN